MAQRLWILLKSINQVSLDERKTHFQIKTQGKFFRMIQYFFKDLQKLLVFRVRNMTRSEMGEASSGM